MSYTDDYKIFLNILAQSPEGMNDPNLIGKFSKAKATIHGLETYNQMMPPPPPPDMPVEGQNINAEAVLPPEGTPSTTQPLMP